MATRPYLPLIASLIFLATPAIGHAQDTCYRTILGCEYRIVDAKPQRDALIHDALPRYAAAPGTTILSGALLPTQAWSSLRVVREFSQRDYRFQTGEALSVVGAIWIKDEQLLIAMPPDGPTMVGGRSRDCLLVSSATLRPYARRCYYHLRGLDGVPIPRGAIGLVRGDSTYDGNGPLLARASASPTGMGTPFKLSYDRYRDGHCLVSLQVGNDLTETLIQSGSRSIDNLLQLEDIQCSPDQVSFVAHVLAQ